MTNGTDFKLLSEKKIDLETTLTVTQNLMSHRIFVQFTTNKPRMVLQRNFQDDYFGQKESKKFAKSIRSTNDLRKHFGLSLKEKK